MFNKKLTIIYEKVKIEMSAINYNDINYVKLRDIAKALNIEIIYDAETNTVSINTDKLYTEE